MASLRGADSDNLIYFRSYFHAAKLQSIAFPGLDRRRAVSRMDCFLMTLYTVTWTIDIEADTPEDAATQALAIQRNPESIATCFVVAARSDPHTIYITDLTPDTEEDIPHA